MMWEFALTASKWVAAVGAALLTLWKAIALIWTIAQKVTRLLELVEHELQPNAGGSLRDRVDLLVRRMDSLERDLLVDEENRKERQALADAFRRDVLDRLRAMDGGPGGSGYDPPEGAPV